MVRPQAQGSTFARKNPSYPELGTPDLTPPPLPPSPPRFQANRLPAELPKIQPPMYPGGMERTVPARGIGEWEGDFQSGFDPESSAPGRMQYQGPQLNTATALEGLRAAPQNPLVQLAGMAQGYMASNRPQDQARGANIQQFTQGQLAPQRAAQAPIEAGLMAQHPAIRGLAETEARQKAYPAQQQALGVEGAARARALGDTRQAALTAQGRVAAGQMDLPIDELIKAYSDITQLADQDNPNTIQSREMYLDLLKQMLRQRGLNIEGIE